MADSVSYPSRPKRSPASLRVLALILAGGFNLRIAITSVSAILDGISRELDIPDELASLLVSIPVGCFALASPLVSLVAKRIGIESALRLGFVLIASFTVLRVIGGSVTFFVGTVVLGVGITFGNVLLPVVIKMQTSFRADKVMALHVICMGAGGSVAALATAPLDAWLGVRGALCVWAAVVLFVALGRFPRRERSDVKGDLSDPRSRNSSTVGNLWGNSTAWSLSLFLGFQSFSYYALTGWLPQILVEMAEVSVAQAGFGLGMFQLLGIVGSLAVAPLISVLPNHRLLVMGIAVGWLVVTIGLLSASEFWLMWVVVGGIAQGSGVSLAFALLVLRCRTPEVVRSMSWMMQSIGYLMGGLGPVVMILLFTDSFGWGFPLGVLAVISLAMVRVGFVATDHDRVLG